MGCDDRRIAYAYTGCLAHVEVTERIGSGAISRIAGFWKHSEECLKTPLGRLPTIPLHPDVYRVALNQLEDGARWVFTTS